MRIGLHYIALWLFPIIALSQTPQQQIDSLILQLNNEKNDTVKVNILHTITRTYAGFDLNKANEFAKKALSHSEKVGWDKGIATSEKYLGNILLEKGQRQDALPHFEKAYDMFTKLEDEEGMITSLYNLGSLHQHENRYSLALEYFIKGTAKAESINNNRLLAMGSYRVSTIFVQQHNFEKARAYAKSAIQNFKKEKNYTELANSLEILGVSYLLDKNTEKAKAPFYEALKYLDTIGNDFGKAKIYTQLVECYNNEPARQLDYIDKSLEIWNRNNVVSIYTISNTGNKGIIYINLYQNDSLRNQMPKTFTMSKPELLTAADNNLKEGIALAKESGNKEQLMQFYKAHYRVLEEQGLYKKAIETLNSSYQIGDSLYSQNNKNKIASIESEYEIQLRDKEIEVNKLKLDSQKKQQTYMLGGLALFATIGGLLFYQSYNRRKTNKKLQLLNAELDQANKIKTRFFSILNHDLRSPVANLIHFLHLQKDQQHILDNETKERLESNTISGAENLLSSMEDILLWSKGQMENFKPEPKSITVEDLFLDNKKVFSGYLNVHFEYHNPENVQLFTDENYLKTIMRNLTSNAINVLGNAKTPTITWKAWKENGQKILSITDNGKGASQDQFKALYDETEVVGIKSGLGLHLIRDLAKAIDCGIQVESQLGTGTTFTLLFK